MHCWNSVRKDFILIKQIQIDVRFNKNRRILQFFDRFLYISEGVVLLWKERP